jgi:small acid-soluble spore protein I (minor)
MNIDIRKNIIENFRDTNAEDLKVSINEAVEDKDEITLPGLGVLFELLWKNSNDKEAILKTVIEGIKKEKTD